MLQDYIDLLLFLKKNIEPISGNAMGRAMNIYNTTAQSRLEELELIGLVEKVYRSKHMNLWNITYNGKAVIKLLTIIDEFQ